MNQGVKTILYPVKDIARAKQQFTTFLGVEPFVDQSYYVAYMVGDHQQIGLVPNGEETGLTSPLPHYHVDDIKKALQLLVEAGAQVQQDVKDVGGGKLVASLTDADGNSVGLIQDKAK